MKEKKVRNKHHMIRLKAGLIGFTIGASALTGCGASIPEMSEEESAQVSEYASGLLLKYDANYQGRLIEEKEEPVIQGAEEMPEEEKVDTGVPEGTVVQDNTGGQSEIPANKDVQSDVQTYLGVEGFQIQYTGFEVKERYPDQGETELYMAMGAAPDSKLLVLKFEASNLGDADAQLDTLSQNVRYKVSVNGGVDSYTLTTMLIDDLSAFKGTIPAGGSQQLVLISQIPNSIQDQIESITLKMKGKEMDAVQVLK